MSVILLGDYFEVADTVIMMDNFQALDVTARAKSIAAESPLHMSDHIKDQAFFVAEVQLL